MAQACVWRTCPRHPPARWCAHPAQRRVSQVARRAGSLDDPSAMSDRRSPGRIGYALQALAADLAAERRRVLLLRRENRALKAKLAVLQYDLDRLGEAATAESEQQPGEEGRSFTMAS